MLSWSHLSAGVRCSYLCMTAWVPLLLQGPNCHHHYPWIVIARVGDQCGRARLGECTSVGASRERADEASRVESRAPMLLTLSNMSSIIARVWLCARLLEDVRGPGRSGTLNVPSQSCPSTGNSTSGTAACSSARKRHFFPHGGGCDFDTLLAPWHS